MSTFFTKKRIILLVIFISIIAGSLWLFLYAKNNKTEFAASSFNLFQKVSKLLPLTPDTKKEIEVVNKLVEFITTKDDTVHTFLMLLQNADELRPGGGFLGQYAIIKTKNGEIISTFVEDANLLDQRISADVPTPYPFARKIQLKKWKFRDSNYSPDFSLNAKQAETFYQMGQGQEQFDGVVAITTNVLSSFLRVTGPVTLEGFPGTYGADNAILDLEYQVEQGYLKQDIAFGERKSVMNLLGFEILHRVKDASFSKKYELFKVVLDDLHRKDIQLSFKDEILQEQVVSSGFDGAVDKTWKNDYLFLVDANLNSFKSDYYMKRSYDYTIDLSSPVPKAVLKVTYKNTTPVKDWFAKDYQTFLRVYVPKGSYLEKVTGAAKDPVFGGEFNKKYFGVLVQVPILTEKTVVFEYTLSENFKSEWYDLKIQKQAGLNDVPVTVTTIMKDGQKEEKHSILNRDMMLSDMK
ncbi:MAG TPA: hypothetical protein DHV33_02280 [Candidatus Moranbacteria bacterium]|nr:hypothetical protein [Candidatus Moranbacteria bacterium]